MRPVPILLLAGSIVLLQWMNGRVDWAVPARTLAVCAAVAVLVRLVPLRRLAGRLRPGSRFYLAGLYLLFVRHFAETLVEETRRSLQARKISAPGLWRAGGMRSLAWALASIFRRTLTRAERFYAAQSLSGIVS